MIDKKNKEQLAQYMMEQYCGKKLVEVKVFVHNYQFPFENKSGWQLADAGIQMKFEDESIFTYCFDREWEVVDFFDSPLEEQIERVSAFDQSGSSLWKPLLNNYLNRMNFHWNWYADFENNVYFIPLVIEFIFVDNKRLSLAAVRIGIEKNEITINLDSEGEILAGFSEEIQSIIQTELNSLQQ
jgi:hypothetical protein